MNIQETIFWGVVSGIITSVLIFIIGLFITKILIPWYQKLIYDGVDLRDLWIAEKEFDDESRYRYQMSVKQKAHKISGIATINRDGTAGGNYTQSFELNGSTWEGYLTVNLRSTDHKSLSFVSGLFKIENRGRELKGHWAYRGRNDLVDNETLTFMRQTKS
jgi:hypothetical protein